MEYAPGMPEFLGVLRDGRNLHLAQMQEGCLAYLPWEVFDCVVLNCQGVLSRVDVEILAKEVTQAETDWVQTVGPQAEILHDAIDAMSVRIGRQVAVGDGNPMTSWHERVATPDQMIRMVLGGTFGGSDNVVVIVLGDEATSAGLKSRLLEGLDR